MTEGIDLTDRKGDGPQDGRFVPPNLYHEVGLYISTPCA